MTTIEDVSALRQRTFDARNEYFLQYGSAKGKYQYIQKNQDGTESIFSFEDSNLLHSKTVDHLGNISNVYNLEFYENDSYTETYDRDNDGEYEHILKRINDTNNRVIYESHYTDGKNSTSFYEYNENGQRTSKMSSYSENGKEVVSTEKYSYDDNGRLLQTKVDYKDNDNTSWLKRIFSWDIHEDETIDYIYNEATGEVEEKITFGYFD